MKMVKTCRVYSCGHIEFISGSGRLLIHPDECIRKKVVCAKCHDHEEARKASRMKMGWFVGSDKAEYAWDKKRNEAAKKKEMDEMSAGIKVGDIVTVSALPSCRKEIRPKLPAKGKIVDILMYPYPYPHIAVEIDGKKYRAEKEMLILA